MARILVLHGPNLNLLGSREPGLYGADTLQVINDRIVARGAELGHEVECYQANGEHLLVERIHQARTDGVGFILINPAAFTHTSVALRDALLGVEIPFIEIHLSNVHAREAFRHHSYLADVAVGTIAGLGADGYLYALAAASRQLSDT